MLLDKVFVRFWTLDIDIDAPLLPKLNNKVNFRSLLQLLRLRLFLAATRALQRRALRTGQPIAPNRRPRWHQRRIA